MKKPDPVQALHGDLAGELQAVFHYTANSDKGFVIQLETIVVDETSPLEAAEKILCGWRVVR